MYVCMYVCSHLGSGVILPWCEPRLAPAVSCRRPRAQLLLAKRRRERRHWRPIRLRGLLMQHDFVRLLACSGAARPCLGPPWPCLQLLAQLLFLQKHRVCKVLLLAARMFLCLQLLAVQPLHLRLPLPPREGGAAKRRRM